jgi:uncharacterized iron-regulated membrane protein
MASDHAPPSRGLRSKRHFHDRFGHGWTPDHRSQLTLNRKTGADVRWEPFTSYNSGRRLRLWIRFTHTGEAGSIAGETIAAVLSLGGALLVWTGLSLAIRRLRVATTRPAPSADQTQRPGAQVPLPVPAPDDCRAN